MKRRGRMILACFLAAAASRAGAEPLLAERNKALVERVFAALESGELEVLNQAFHPEGKTHFGLETSARGGPHTSFAEAAPFPGALEEREVTLHELLAEGELVAVRSTICGRHARPLRGVAPTGRRICSAYLNLYRIRDGRIVDNFVGTDREQLMRQLAPPEP